MKQSVKDILSDDFWIMPATPKYIDDGVPYITSKNIKNGVIDFSKVNYISQDAYENISKNRPILVGDILVSMIGTLGETAEVMESDGLFYGQNMFLVRLDEKKVNKRYFLNFFKSNCVKRALEGKQNQSTQKYLKANHIEDLIIPIPTLDEQKKIAEQLDKLLFIISLRNNELKQFDDLIKARFVEMFGNPITNEKGWEIAELNNVCDGIGDGLHGTPEYNENGGYPFINGNNLNGIIEVTPATKMVDETTYKKHYIELSDNAILLSINGTLGKLAFYNGEEVMLGKSACYCNLKSNINRDFVYGVMKADAFMEFLESNATASTIKNVGLKAIRGFKLILPPEEVQNQYADFVNQINKSKVAAQKALDEAQLLFDSLMQKYFG